MEVTGILPGGARARLDAQQGEILGLVVVVDKRLPPVSDLPEVLEFVEKQTSPMYIGLSLFDPSPPELVDLLVALRGKVRVLLLTLHHYPPELQLFMGDNEFQTVVLSVGKHGPWDPIVEDALRWKTKALIVKNLPERRFRHTFLFWDPRVTLLYPSDQETKNKDSVFWMRLTLVCLALILALAVI